MQEKQEIEQLNARSLRTQEDGAGSACLPHTYQCHRQLAALIPEQLHLSLLYLFSSPSFLPSAHTHTSTHASTLFSLLTSVVLSLNIKASP